MEQDLFKFPPPPPTSLINGENSPVFPCSREQSSGSIDKTYNSSFTAWYSGQGGSIDRDPIEGKSIYWLVCIFYID